MGNFIDSFKYKNALKGLMRLALVLMVVNLLILQIFTVDNVLAVSDNDTGVKMQNNSLNSSLGGGSSVGNITPSSTGGQAVQSKLPPSPKKDIQVINPSEDKNMVDMVVWIILGFIWLFLAYMLYLDSKEA